MVAYTNVLDHAFDLGKVVSEVQRVLRAGGFFVADLAYGTEEGAIGGEYEAFWWNDSNTMINLLAVMGNFDLVESRELPSVRSARWHQGVMRKPSNLVTGVARDAETLAKAPFVHHFMRSNGGVPVRSDCLNGILARNNLRLQRTGHS